MEWYPWLTPYYRELIHQYRLQQAHHAILLCSAKGNGVQTLVNAVGRWLMCQQRNGDKICGQCHGCHLMQAGFHPDWYVLLAEEGKNQLGIEPIRKMLEKLYTSSQQGGVKVVWLPQAEILSPAAANALLKTLEEPPEETYFLLGCVETGNILSTIRSRCMPYRITCGDSSMTLHWLKQKTDLPMEKLHTALHLSAMAPLAALQFLNSSLWQERQIFCNKVEQASKMGDWLQLLPELLQDNIVERMHWLYTLLLDSIKWSLSIKSFIINQDKTELIAWLSQDVTSEVLQMIARDCSYYRYKLLTIAGLNKELILSERLLYWERKIANGVDSVASKY